MTGDFFIATAIGTNLTKLAVRYINIVPEPNKQNAFCAEAMLIISSMLHLGKSGSYNTIY